MDFFGDDFLLPALIAIGIVALLIAWRHARASMRHARARRPLAAMHRFAWMLVFLLLALLTGGSGIALRGYRLLTGEIPVATISARQVARQQFAVRTDFADGTHSAGALHGDEWQLDARVIKWKPVAVALGAEPLYRVERLSGRYRDTEQAQTTAPSVIDLAGDSVIDLWQLKQRFPRWLPWIDADYGSAAYLPLVDGARYSVSLSPLGGLVARPADAASAQKLKAAGW
ncbi:MAG: hypothetical protein ACREPT_03840 [Rudaea sp.]